MTNKNKKELVILVIGIVILILSVLHVNKSFRNSGEEYQFPGPPKLLSEEAEAVLPVWKPGPVSVNKEVNYHGRENRDPLDNNMVLNKEVKVEEQKAEAVFPEEKFLISAIIWGARKPQAIINDTIVTTGEMLDGGEIVKIDKQGVHIKFEGREALLSIK